MASTDALPIPRKNVAFRHYFAMYKSDGTIITGWTGAAGNISKDGAATNPLTNTPTEIGSFGRGYIDLTSGEMNADAVIYSVTITNVGAVALTVVLYPMEDVDIRSNVVDWSGSAVASPDTAGYPKITVKAGTGTGEINLSSGNVSIQSGTGTGQLDFTSGVVKASLVQILGTALTETSGQIAAAFKKFFDIASPTSTANRITLVDTTTTLTNTPSDSTGVTTLLTRIGGNLTIAGGSVDANLKSILGTTLTETAGQIAGAFKQFFNISSPTGTINLIPTVTNATNVTNAPPDSSGVTTLLSRLSSGRATLLDNLSNLDAAVSADATRIWAAGTRSLTTFGTLVADVWAYVTRTLTAQSDSSGITTLLSRIGGNLTITGGKVDVNNISAIQNGLATSTEISDLQTHGDSTWTTAVLTSLLTSSAFTSALTALQSHGDSAWATAVITSLLTSTDFDTAIAALQAHGDSAWVDSADFAAILAELAVIEAKTSLITADNFSITGPNVPGTTNFEFVYGNDYTLTSGRTLPSFSNSDWAVYNLTTATSVTFKTKSKGKTFSLVKDLIVNSDIDLSLELTAEELTDFGPTISIAELKTYDSPHTFSVQAVLATGDHVTLAQGRIFIIEDVT